MYLAIFFLFLISSFLLLFLFFFSFVDPAVCTLHPAPRTPTPHFRNNNALNIIFLFQCHYLNTWNRLCTMFLFHKVKVYMQFSLPSNPDIQWYFMHSQKQHRNCQLDHLLHPFSSKLGEYKIVILAFHKVLLYNFIEEVNCTKFLGLYWTNYINLC